MRIYLCVRADGIAHGVVIGLLEVEEGGLEVGDLCHVAERAAVDVVDAEHMRVLAERLEDGRSRRRAGGKGEAVVAARLEVGEQGLEGIAVGVSRAGVLVALVDADGLLGVCRRQRDGRDDCAGVVGGVRADVDGAGAEAVECDGHGEQ